MGAEQVDQVAGASDPHPQPDRVDAQDVERHQCRPGRWRRQFLDRRDRGAIKGTEQEHARPHSGYEHPRIRRDQPEHHRERGQHQEHPEQQHRPARFAGAIPPVSSKAAEQAARHPGDGGNEPGQLGDLGTFEPALLHVPQLVKRRRAYRKMQRNPADHDHAQRRRSAQRLADLAQMRPPARPVRGGMWHSRIAHRQHHYRQHQPGRAQQVEAVTPSDRRPQETSNQQARARTDRHAQVIQRDRQPQLPGLEPVCQQRCRRWGQCRFPHPDQGAGQRQRQEPARRAAGRSQQAPQGDRHRDQPPAVHPVGQHPHEQPGCGIEDQEEQPGQQAVLGITQAQFGFDEIGEAGQQLPIDEVQNVDNGQQRQQPPARCHTALTGLRNRGRRRHVPASLCSIFRHLGGDNRACQAQSAGQRRSGAAGLIHSAMQLFPVPRV